MASALLFVAALLVSVGVSADSGILLSGVQTLTFMDGRQTTASRSSPLPQLRCAGCSPAAMRVRPASVQCRNVGTDDRGKVQWECEAELDASVRFGVTTVSCEGFSHPGDEYILPGSCALEYTLVETGAAGGGHHGGNYGNSGGSDYLNANAGDHFGQQARPNTFKYDPHAGNKGSGLLSSMLIMGIFSVILFGICTTLNQQRNNQQGAGNAGAGFRPPPYNPMGAGVGGGGGGGGYYGAGGAQVHGGGMFGGYRPGNFGFWPWGLGAMAGAGMLGNLFGRGRHHYQPNVGFEARGPGAHAAAGARPGAAPQGGRNQRTFATTDTR